MDPLFSACPSLSNVAHLRMLGLPAAGEFSRTCKFTVLTACFPAPPRLPTSTAHHSKGNRLSRTPQDDAAEVIATRLNGVCLLRDSLGGYRFRFPEPSLLARAADFFAEMLPQPPFQQFNSPRASEYKVEHLLDDGGWKRLFDARDARAWLPGECLCAVVYIGCHFIQVLILIV